MGLLVQLSDVKTYLQITYATDDTLLTQILANVSAAVESYCKSSFSAVLAYTDILDGGVDSLVLNNRPIASITGLLDLTMNSEGEQVGLGDGSTASFPFALLNPPLVASSLAIGGSGVNGYDDGAGNITGVGVAAGSTINYSSGVGVLKTSAAPESGIELLASYTPRTAIVSPALYQYDARRGLIFALPTPPSDLPIPAGLFSFLGMNPVWGEGARRWQVNYTAGFSSVPADVQLAALTWIATKYAHREPLGKETIGDYSYATEKGGSGLPLEVEQLLRNYKEVIF